MNIDQPIHLGISTCPNDTFAFHAIMHQRIDLQGLQFTVELADVQDLNRRLMGGEFDVAKASFFAALRLADETVVLPSGAALGFGVGPLLLSRHRDLKPQDLSPEFAGSSHQPIVLCPGEFTTATMLYRIFFPESGEPEQVIFSEIMPRLGAGSADFGVCIHEGRFTWQDAKLFMTSDLGSLWEAQTQLPLPLGGILARRTLPADVLQRVQDVIKDSIQYGLDHRQETLPTMRHYAQEFTDEVLFSHVDLYVNSSTVFLDAAGQRSLAKLGEMATRSGLLPQSSNGLEILG